MSNEKAREQVGQNIDGVGEFMAKPGTAIHELAGAASYWSKRAKQSEAELESAKTELAIRQEILKDCNYWSSRAKAAEKVISKQWKRGFSWGILATSVAVLTVDIMSRLF